jgi:ADP-L-glycero-D-manno-heptose 6-epimerase
MSKTHSLERGTILVTGGAGFIGSAVVHELNLRGYTNILISDYLGCDEKWKNLVKLKFDEFCPVELVRKSIIEEGDLTANVRTIFHLGACSSTTEKNMDYLADNNYRSTLEIAKFAVKRGVRLVYASSAATYGDGSQGFDDADENLLRLRPLNAYGFSKHMFDVHAQKLGLLKHITGLKYFNVYGPNEQHKGDMRSVISKVYSEAEKTGVIRLFKSHHPDYADGESLRDFIYVKDAARMTVDIAERSDAAGIYNVGTGRARSWNDVAKAIFAALGREPRIEYVDMPENLRGKYQYYTEARMQKFLMLMPEGGARYSLEDAVCDYVKNYLLTGKFLGD